MPEPGPLAGRQRSAQCQDAVIGVALDRDEELAVGRHVGQGETRVGDALAETAVATELALARGALDRLSSTSGVSA